MVDAIGFLTVGGLFVSFMSGNTTQLAVGATTGATATVVLAAAIIATFVGGAVGGFLVGRRFRRRAAGLVALVGVVLGAAALVAPLSPRAAALLMAAAMGVENAVFERDGDVAIGVTYMTGTLVKMAQRLAAAFTGGPRREWVPFLLLWTALFTGAMAGAFLHARLGARALWVTAGLAMLLALVAARVDGTSSRRSTTPL